MTDFDFKVGTVIIFANIESNYQNFDLTISISQ